MKETKGLSPVAVQAEEFGKSLSKWTRKQKRPRKFRNNIYGLVVHTTGSSITTRALKKKLPVIDACVQHYLESGGTHYVAGYGGQLVQVGNEQELAYGASVKRQISEDPWYDSLSETTRELWIERWAHLENVKSPMDLFPAKYVNYCNAHVEMPPVFGFSENDIKTKLSEPMREELWFTKEQHTIVADLAIDMADRYNWWKDDCWWRNGRLVGHEDVSPVTRSVKSGGWDPGGLMKEPRFDWEYVYAIIEAEHRKRQSAKSALEVAEIEVKNSKGPDPYETLVRSFVDFVSSLFTRKK